ncbi:MAG: VOC family protein [Actinobacteria bacterium]|nr:VOC family protein [Actinomycetota bacterium]
MTRPPNVSPFLWLPEKGLEAAEFYVSLLPDSRITDIEHVREGTTVISFDLAGHPYVIMEHPGRQPLNDAFSIAVRVDGQAEIDRLWDALMDGGTALACGWLTDRYGITWQVSPQQMDEMRRKGTPAQTKAVMEAMMDMVKLDVAVLEAAFEAAAETV